MVLELVQLELVRGRETSVQCGDELCVERNLKNTPLEPFSSL